MIVHWIEKKNSYERWTNPNKAESKLKIKATVFFERGSNFFFVENFFSAKNKSNSIFCAWFKFFLSFFFIKASDELSRTTILAK